MEIKLDGKAINNLVMKYYIMSFHGNDDASELLEIFGIDYKTIVSWREKLGYEGFKEISSFVYRMYHINGWKIWAKSSEDAILKYQKRAAINWSEAKC
ncbi:hypothetical protein [Paenibacillus illinoisensis]|uniref:hypothetical protein n=1 Tax=Paenibacillus illinoisensis TaxID=59845 RepID=UPI0030191B81